MAPQKCFLCKKTNPIVTLHKFPKNKDNCSLWKDICNLKDYDVVSTLFICSEHFTNDDYCEPRAKEIGGVLKLKPNRLPSINVPKPKVILIPYKPKPDEATPKEPTCSATVENPINVSPVSPHLDITFSVDCDKGFTTPKKRKFNDPRYFGEVTSADVSSPKKARRVVLMAKRQISKQQKTIKALRAKNFRLKRKVTSLETLIKHLKEKNILSEDAGDAIIQTLPESIKELLSRNLKKSKRQKYSPELRTFALSLQFYSTAAYNYVRKSWNNLLPHPSTLRAWYSVVEGKPGFTKESFNVLKSVSKNKKLIGNILIDEMSIKEELIYDKKQFIGVINVGNNFCETENDTNYLAKNALVFMLVGINFRFKLPIGYFLIKGLTGSERANLLKTCLELLEDTGIVVRSITFDGAASNINMANNLGANFSYDSKNFKPFIFSPRNKYKIYIFFDACHMIKLVRNTLGDKEILIDGLNRKILWQNIRDLHELQNIEGLHLANKLTKKHLNFNDNRMNVKLAAQTLSESVANSFEYLKITNANFADVDGIINYCKIFNNTFDLLNCKNKFTKKKSYCRAIDKNSFKDLKIASESFIDYIAKLKDVNGLKLINGPRKIGFLGLIVDLVNVFSLFLDLNNDIEYLLSFKLSQDFLEIFFSAIRCRGGWNNNPNAKQFEAAYKRLLVKNEITFFTNSNCLADGMPILDVSSRIQYFSDDIIEGDIFTDIFDHDYINTMWDLNKYVENVVEYISGYICKKILVTNNCNICQKHLVQENKNLLFINIKNKKNKLLYPSEDVIYISKICERIFRQYDNIKIKNIKFILSNKIFKTCHKYVFNSYEMIEHIKEQDILNNHVNQLIKLIINVYLDIRLFHKSKMMSDKDNYIRNKYTKLILFKNQ